MHLYTAAVYTNSYMPGQNLYEKLTDNEKEIAKTAPNILESWHYVGKQKFVDEMRANGARVFLDSGAFSAFTLGVTLKVSDYCEYIQRNIDILRVEDGNLMASVLDGIGDPLQTYRNQKEMEARGCKPLPCFHFGEDENYLEYYVKNYDYITIGGMVGKSVKQLSTWLDRIWGKYLVDGSGRAKIKVHAFGITSFKIMENYPWYSCDSSSWIQSTAFGVIVTPEHGPIQVSKESPSRKVEGRHITTLSMIEKDSVFKLIESQGFNYERLSSVYQSRAAYNLWAYREINNQINKKKSSGQLLIQKQELF